MILDDKGKIKLLCKFVIFNYIQTNDLLKFRKVFLHKDIDPLAKSDPNVAVVC